jgi:hypothetical protein
LGGLICGPFGELWRRNRDLKRGISCQIGGIFGVRVRDVNRGMCTFGGSHLGGRRKSRGIPEIFGILGILGILEIFEISRQVGGIFGDVVADASGAIWPREGSNLGGIEGGLWFFL